MQYRIIKYFKDATSAILLKNEPDTQSVHSDMNTESIPRLIERVVAVCPDNVAICNGLQELTYRDLHRRAERFASYLAQRGVGNGDAVAICFNRSIEWIVAALGILRSGAAYIPVDTDWPEARLRHVLIDSGAKVAVCRAALIDRLGVEIQGIDPLRDAENIENSHFYATDRSRMDDLAYMIYTSGSSGVPKAVEITHANLSDLVNWHKEAFDVSCRDRASHLATLSFDAAVWEIWPNLSAGATVCVPKERARASAEAMKEWILNERITVAFVPTSHATSLMGSTWPKHTSLRLLLTGGDVLQKTPEKSLPFEVYNNYGPTECTVVATSSLLEPNSGATPPIGRPRRGATIYLLDEAGQQVRDGECGEIYIGGTCVGKGYHNLPELTAQHFLPDSFAPESGHRMFRTGDLGARHSDGQIRFLGRIDRQVKINGKRLELDEVGAVLARHPSVERAHVVAENVTENRKRLVAYYQLKEKAPEPGAKNLSAHLHRTLPQFMVPEVFYRMCELPISSNGKVVEGALPSASGASSRTHSHTSRITVEAELLSVVRELLKDDTIGPSDEFFLAGGDSLFGTQLILSLQSKLDIDLTFDQVFESGTVERLADLITSMPQLRALETSALPSSGITQGRCGRQLKYPIYWIRPMPAFVRVIETNHSFVPLTLSPVDIEGLSTDSSFEAIAERFARKLIEMDVVGPYCLGGFCRNALLAYEVAVQLGKIARPTPILILLDCPGPASLGLSRPFSPRLRDFRYVLKRSAQIGPVGTISRLRIRIAEVLASRHKSQEKYGFFETLERAIETSVSKYRPERYKGSALLLLASDHAPHLDFAGEWNESVRKVSAEYIQGHHYDLSKDPQMREISAKILSYLESQDESERSCAIC